MAEEGIAQQQQNVSQQKILILPPMRGLNLYDNPFTMDMSFAVELVNFMPPTTVMTVRPGIQMLAELYGAVRGIYSYATGATKNYGKHWYDQTIEEGERQLLILKFAQNSGDSVIYSYNPLGQQYESIATIKDHNYTKDSTNFKHSIFFCSGNQNSPMYVWSSRVGFKPMSWTASDGDTELSDLENITFYNGYLFANSYNTFDIYYMKESTADPTQSTGWDKFWSFFSPNYAGQISLDGTAIKGGSIMKMFHLSRNGLNGVESYLGVCTNMGEVVLFQGTPDPDEEKNTLHAVGRFEIPVPLNKNCFCQMEGDMVVATKNGLVSLMRVVFGQSNSVTQSLETRIKNLFDDYMFKMGEFREWIGLYYNFKNRLLILNVPTQMPIPLNKIARGYQFTDEQRIMLPKAVEDNPSDIKNQLCGFIKKYLYANYINYKIFLQFNESVVKNADGIYVTFETELVDSDGVTATSLKTLTYVSFYIICAGVRTDFFNDGDGEKGKRIQFLCDDFTDPDILVTFDVSPGAPRFKWNESLKKTYGTLSYYEFSFPKSLDSYIVTDMIVKVNPFAEFEDFGTLNDVILDFELEPTTKLIGVDSLKGFKYIPDFPNNKSFNGFMGEVATNLNTNYHLQIDDEPSGVLVADFFNNYIDVRTDVQIYIKSIVASMVDQNDYFQDLVRNKDLPSSAIVFNINYKITNINEGKDYEYKHRCTLDNFGKREVVKDGAWEFQFDYHEAFGFPDMVEYFKMTIMVNVFYLREKWVIPFVFFGWPHDKKLEIPDVFGEPISYTPVDFSRAPVLDFLGDEWKVSQVEIHADLPSNDTHWRNLFIGAGDYRVYPWQQQTIDDEDKLNYINMHKYQWLFSPFQMKNTDPPPPPPPHPKGTINEKWSNLPIVDDKSLEWTNEINYPLFEDWDKDWLTTWTEYASTVSSYSFDPYNLPDELYFPNGAYNPILKIVKGMVGDIMHWFSSYFLDPVTVTEEYYYQIYKDDTLLDTYKFRTTYTVIVTRDSENPGNGDVNLEISMDFNYKDNNKIVFHFNVDINVYGDIIGSIRVSSLANPDQIEDFKIDFDDTSTYKIGNAGTHQTGGVFLQDLLIEGRIERDEKLIANQGDADDMNNNYQGWYFSPFLFNPRTSAKNKKNAEVFKSKPPVRISRKLMGLVGSNAIGTPVQNTNFDLTLVPLFTGVNILAPFRSSQYVMDSYYGTWAQWKDVNMIDGIDHANEFYFIIPKDYKPFSSQGGFIYNESMLCKFNPEANGDFEDMFNPQNTRPITVNYKTAAGNFGDNRIKEISKIKIYATASTFWGDFANNLAVTMHSDFFENPIQKYQHEKARPDIRKVLGLSEDFDLRDLTYSQKRKYNRIYLELSSFIRNIEMGLMCKPANRIALELDLEIEEHNIIIYGYELYFKVMNKL
jgi:hypothetical protein